MQEFALFSAPQIHILPELSWHGLLPYKRCCIILQGACKLVLLGRSRASLALCNCQGTAEAVQVAGLASHMKLGYARRVDSPLMLCQGHLRPGRNLCGVCEELYHAGSEC